MSRPRRDKSERLIESVQEADSLASVFDNPYVDAFFTKYEAKLVDRLAACPASDDDGRREYGLELAAMREFRTYMTGAIEKGRRAKQTLTELNNDG